MAEGDPPFESGRGLVTAPQPGVDEDGQAAMEVLETLVREVRRHGSWEKFVASLPESERLRVEAAIHLLSDQLDRLARGALE